MQWVKLIDKILTQCKAWWFMYYQV